MNIVIEPQVENDYNNSDKNHCNKLQNFGEDNRTQQGRAENDILRENDGRVVLFSVVVPTAGFNVGVAMQRNRYIYAQSSGTVVVRSDKGKGGTWNGA